MKSNSFNFQDFTAKLQGSKFWRPRELTWLNPKETIQQQNTDQSGQPNGIIKIYVALDRGSRINYTQITYRPYLHLCLRTNLIGRKNKK